MKILALLLLSSVLVFGQASPNGVPNQTIGTASTNSATGQYTPGTYTAPVTGAVARSPQSKMTDVISVEDLGAIADGSTDDTTAINAALTWAAAGLGRKITFPCSTGNSYKITAPLNQIPPFTTLEGTNPIRCSITYSPLSAPGATPNTVINLVGSGFVTIENLRFVTTATYVPSTIVELGRTTGNPNGGGQHIFRNVSILGYATTALMYSISSEVLTADNIYMERDGGGASYGFYTSGIDDLSVCSTCITASNLSMFWKDFAVVDLTTGAFSAFGDQLGGGTGGHYFRDGYVGLNTNTGSVGFRLVSGTSAQGGPNDTFSADNIRIENGGQSFIFKINSGGSPQTSMSHIDVHGVTLSTTNNTSCMTTDSGLTIDRSYFVSNVCETNSGTTGSSSFYKLTNSVVDEFYGGTITISTADNSNHLRQRGSTTFSLAAGMYANTEIGPWQVTTTGGTQKLWVDPSGNINSGDFFPNSVNATNSVTANDHLNAPYWASTTTGSGGNGTLAWQNSANSLMFINGLDFSANSSTQTLGRSGQNWGNIFSNAYSTGSNCSSSASPAVCGSAVAGSFVIAAAATTVTVNTTAVTASSQIFIQPDTTLGTKLSVTCNTATTVQNDEAKVSARSAGTSFQVTATGPFTTNPGCFSYLIIN